LTLVQVEIQAKKNHPLKRRATGGTAE